MHEPTPPSINHGRLFELTDHEKKALYIGTYEGTKAKPQCDEQLDELENLGFTYGLATGRSSLCLCGKSMQLRHRQGEGTEIKALCEELQIEIVVFDDELGPQQQRNLEKSLKSRSSTELSLF